MSLPQDPIILLSYINTMLRDKYSSLDELCDDLSCAKNDIIEKLRAVNYEYDREQNKFI